MIDLSKHKQITNQTSIDEAILKLESKQVQQITFYQYDFSEKLLSKMNEIAQEREKICWSFSDCKNIDKNKVNQIFESLQMNNRLQKFHFNFTTIADLTQKDYFEFYEKLIFVDTLRTINCPNYAVMIKGAANLFEKNTNINRVVSYLLDNVYLKPIQKFLSSIQREFEILKFKTMNLMNNDIITYSGLFSTINNLKFQALKINKLAFSQILNSNLMSQLFFKCNIKALYIRTLHVRNIQTLQLILKEINCNNSLQIVNIKYVWVTNPESLSFSNIYLNPSITQYKLGITNDIQTIGLDSFLAPNLQLIQLSLSNNPLNHKIISVLKQMPQLQTLKVFINEIRLVYCLAKNLKVQLKKFQIGFSYNCIKDIVSQYTKHIIKEILAIKSNLCQIIFPRNLILDLNRYEQLQILQFFERLIADNRACNFKLEFINNYHLLSYLIQFRLLDYSNFIYLKSFQKDKQLNINSQKQLAIIQKIAFDKFISIYLLFFPQQIYLDLYY